MSVRDAAGLALRRVAAWELPLLAGLSAAALVAEQLWPAVVAVTLGFWLLRFVATGHFSERTPADWPLVLLILLVPVTLWATALPAVTWPEVLRLLAGMSLYYAIVNAPARVRRVIAAGLVAVGLALALVAPLGMEAVMGRLGFIPAVARGKITGLFAGAINPNVLAGVLVMLWPLAVARPLFAWRHLSWGERLLYGAAAVVIAVVIGVSRSRGAYGAAAAAGLVLAVFRWRRGWLMLLLAGLMAGVTSWRVGAARILAELTSAGALGGADVRLEIWSRALYMIQDFPFTGIGMGTFRQVANLLYPFFLAGPDAEIPHAHNLFLQVAVDLGIGGLIAWLAVFGLVCMAAWQIIRRGRRLAQPSLIGSGVGLLACQVAVAVHGLTDAATWGNRPAVLLWAVWGLAMTQLNEDR